MPFKETDTEFTLGEKKKPPGGGADSKNYTLVTY
jgi:hypothetical protein